MNSNLKIIFFSMVLMSLCFAGFVSAKYDTNAIRVGHHEHLYTNIVRPSTVGGQNIQFQNTGIQVSGNINFNQAGRYIRSPGALFIRSGPSSNPSFTITSVGRVGIGTTNPSQALHVDGNIRANSYYVGSTQGRTQSVQFRNNLNQVCTMTVSGGIITAVNC